MNHWLWLALVITTWCWGSTERLKKVTQEIRSVQSALHSAIDKRQQLHQNLNQIEVKISKTVQSLQKVSKDYQDKDRHLKTISEQRQGLQSRLQQHNLQLAQQLRTAYLLNDQSPLQLLFNTDNWHQRRQLLYYHQALYTARQQQIQQIDHLIEQINRKTHQIQQEKHQLDALLAKQDRIHKALVKEQQQRSKILKQLNSTIASKQESLAELQVNKRRLEQIIQRIQKQRRQQKQKTFIGKNPKLPLPTRGQVIQRFGEKRSNHAHQNGIFITNAPNTPVYAVAAGQVAFADWLRGFGLMIIIEHNQGYMSLYAHNSALEKQAGAAVKKKELIAYSGQSGGIAQNGLYFEIRKHGKPVNPRKWLLS